MSLDYSQKLNSSLSSTATHASIAASPKAVGSLSAGSAASSLGAGSRTASSARPARNASETKARAVSHAARPGVTKAELWSARIGFFTGGFTVASWAPLIPFVQAELSLTPMVLGSLLLGLGVGSFVGMPLAGCLSQRIGCRNAIGLSGLLSCLLLVMLAMMPSYLFECVALFLYGITLGCLEVSVNIYGTHLEKKTKGRIMSGLHAAYSIGEVVSVGMITLFFVSGFSPLVTITSLMAALSVALVGILSRTGNERLRAEKKEKSVSGKLRVSGSVVILAVLCAVIFLTEGAMLDWSAIYLRDTAGVAQEASASGYTLFVIAMAISRLVGDRVTEKYGSNTVLTAGVLLLVASLCVMVFWAKPWAVFASLFVMGLGIANLAPILISAASRNKTMDGVRAITTVTTVGYGGLLAGPALIGAVSSAVSLQGAFLGIAVMLTVALFAVRRNAKVFG